MVVRLSPSIHLLDVRQLPKITPLLGDAQSGPFSRGGFHISTFINSVDDRSGGSDGQSAQPPPATARPPTKLSAIGHLLTARYLRATRRT